MKESTFSERALVLAPFGRDAAIAVNLLEQAGIQATACNSIPGLLGELDEGAAFVVIAEESLMTADPGGLVEWLRNQEEWSDLRFILMTNRGGGLERNPTARRFLEIFGNVTFLERPFHPTTFVSLAQSALRGRRRQYEARARLDALLESDLRFRAAVDAVQGVLWTNDPSGRMIGDQPGWQTLTGQSPEEYQDYGWSKAVHPDDAEPTIAAWKHAVETRSTFVFEHRVRRADGQWRTFSIKAVPVLDSDNKIREWVGVHTDITETRRTEAALRDESRLLETLNKTGATIAAELNLDKVVQTVTDAGVQLVGAHFGAFFYNVVNEAGESYMLYALSGANRSDFEKFGKPRATDVFRPTFAGEGVVRSDDILLDPRYGRNKPHKGMPKGHLPVRSYLAVPVVSRSGEVIGGLFFGHPAPRRFSERHEALMLGIAGQAAIAIDNARLYKALTHAKETLENRVAEEIANRAKAEDALRQAQKMEAIGQLTGGVAHDFNNLLTIIKSSTALLRRRDLPEERRRRYIDAISDTVDRASKLTGQLLAFARRQALEPEVFDVGQRVLSTADMLRSIIGSRIVINVDAAEGAFFAKADLAQFETALVNIAVNARDAMDGAGTLTIAVKSTTRNRAENDRTPAPFVAISLADTGIGIPGDKLDVIFEPFFTTKEIGKGTGLGLSQVYGFVKQSGGDIAVESKVGIGTTFTMFLPGADEQQVFKVPIAHSTSTHGGGRRILIVEDNSDIGTFSSHLLEDLGYKPTLAANAKQALELLEDDDAFDLVFSDVVMPGLSGVELGNEIRRRHPNLPVILTSGYSHILANEGRHGFPLLKKPYAVEELSKILRNATRNSVT